MEEYDILHEVAHGEQYRFQNPCGRTYIQNAYSYMAEQAFHSLEYFAQHKDAPYSPMLYAMLCRTFEQMYKGLRYEIQRLFPETPSRVSAMTWQSHYFMSIAREVNTVIPLSPSKEGQDVILDKMDLLGRRCVKASYTDIYTRDQFLSDFKRLSLARARLMASLEELNIQQDEEILADAKRKAGLSI